jgi:hypothetical protein
MVSCADIGTTNDALGRAHALWLESVADSDVRAELQNSVIGGDLETVFEARYGVPLSEFFHVAVNIYFRFLATAIETPSSPALLDTTAATPPVYTVDDEAKVLKILSINADELATDLFGKPRQSWATDFSPLVAIR